MNKQDEITKKAIARLDAIEKEQAALRKIIEQPKPEQWLPDVNNMMGLCHWEDPDYLSTCEQDEKQLALVAWLQAFRNEFAPNWKADWDDTLQEKVYIQFMHDYQKLFINVWSTAETLGAVPMYHDCAEKFIKMYEAGQIDLSWYFGGDV